MKYFVALPFLLFSILLFSQDLPLPEITPKTPEASTLGMFGDVPVNPATGQMSFSIPIHNISVDGNSWPISLQYNYGGLILEGKPSLTGLGWNLQAYGTITKQVRGLPDGHPDGYYGENDVKSLIDNVVTNQNGSGLSYDDYMKFADGTYDSEVDKYTVSIGGENFSFKFRKNGSNYEVYHLSYNNFDVAFTQVPSVSYFEVESFVITDANGVKYYFDATEREYTEVADISANFYRDKTTAWMLSQIDYLNGQSISFNYQGETFFTHNFSASAVSMTGSFETPFEIPNDYTYATAYDDQLKQSEMWRQRLISISFPKGELVFNHTTINGHKIYDEILVKDHNSLIVNEYDLSYKGNRDCLVEVKKNNELLYGFDYYGETGANSLLPDFNETLTNKPWDQDYWKFYNGAGNTQAIGVGASAPVLKNPNILHTRKGAMKQIKYPTGGYSEIDYELNQIKLPYLESSGNDQVGVYNRSIDLTIDAAGTTTYDTQTKTFTQTFDIPVKASLFHKIIGDLPVGNYVTMEINPTADPAYDYSGCYSSPLITTAFYPFVLDDARLKLLPPTGADPEPCPYYPLPMIAPQLILDFDAGNQCPNFPPSSDYDHAMGCSSSTTINQYGESNGEFWIQPGTYEFKIEINAIPGTSLFGQIHLNWWQPEVPDGTDPITIFVNENIGGLRVRNIRHAPLNGNTITNYYNYNYDDGFSSGFENQRPYNSFDLTRNIINDGAGLNYTVTATNHFLNSFSSLDAANGIPVYYKQVKTYTKVDNSFVPLSGGNTGSPTLTSSATNLDGTLILDTTSPFEVWPPIVTDGSGTEGTIETDYPEGYTIFSYDPPLEDMSILYPLKPKHLDKTGARLISQKQFRDDDAEVASTENSQLLFRRQTGANNTELDYLWDDNDDHPWSFLMRIKPILDLNFDVYDYDASSAAEKAEIRSHYDVTFYREVVGYHTPTLITSKIQGVTTVQDITRNAGSNYLVREQKTTDSSGDELKTVFDYPFDLIGESTYNAMDGINQIGTPVQTTQYKKGVEVSKQKTEFIANQDGYKPRLIKASKGGATLETRIVLDTYNSDGNLTQMYKQGDITTTVLYGYDGHYPVAKVVGATHSEVVTALSSTSLPFDGYSYNNATDVELITAFNQVRTALPNAQIISYTYKPLVGVTTVTDPKGLSSYYHYDVYNRLERIEDYQGNVLEEYEYNFINN